jgi:predicted kinase
MEPMLVLVCGLPGAGKSSLVAALASERNGERLECERISFDDLFRQQRRPTTDADGEFDPEQWKRSQGEMAARVCVQLAQWQQQQPATGTDAKRFVLLVDDNFALRSQRKRFAQLAADGK